MTEPTENTLSQSLLEQARKASEQAYSPYSGARVGAAAASEDGRVFVGCNVENASYGLTQCAERNAINNAIVAGVKPGQITELVIFASGFGQLTPCGACRQVMIELLDGDALVHCCNENGEVSCWQVSELFPHPFTLE